jgi:pimeloyl-ACP methyl ester carboxylesterase
VTASERTTDVKGTGQYAEVNGLNLYFETHGAGRPMILLHGGLGSGEMFGPNATRSSSSTCRVTAAPPTSTGRSTSGSWPMTSRR